MTEYKLTYFNLRGLAEPIRYLFALGECPFEDIRIAYTVGIDNEIPVEIKQNLPYDQVPFLEFEGKSLSQSFTIARYLARKFGFLGHDEFQTALIDEIVEAARDYINIVWMTLRPFHLLDTEEAKAARQNVLTVTTPKYVGKFCDILGKNGTGFLVGGSVSLADILVFHVVTKTRDHDIDVVREFPVIGEFLKRFEAIPQINEWIQKRPLTLF